MFCLNQFERASSAASFAVLLPECCIKIIDSVPVQTSSISEYLALVPQEMYCLITHSLIPHPITNRADLVFLDLPEFSAVISI